MSLRRNLFPIAILALGIGLATSVYSLVHAVLLRSLPYPNADQLVYVWSPNPHIDSAPKELGPSNALFYEWQRNASFFEHLALFQPHTVRLPNQTRIGAVKVSGNFFAALGVQPQLGRVLSPEDDQPGKDAVVMISHNLWQTMFGGDRNLAGRKLRLDRRDLEIVGVMPSGFAFPQPWELPPSIRDRDRYDVWLPFGHSAKERADDGFVFGIGEGIAIGRLRPGLSETQAQSAMSNLTARAVSKRQGPGADSKALVTSLLDSAFGDVRGEMWLLLGAVAMVLLLTCANVANLLVARFAARQRELQVRTALGATRARLIHMLLRESVTLSLAGGILGTALAYLAVRWMIHLAPVELPRIAEATIDVPILLFALGASLATGLFCGLLASWPAASGASLLQVRGIVTNSRLQNALMASEVALSLLLLTGAGLLVRSYLYLAAESPGYDADTLSVQVTLPDGYPPQRQTAAFRSLIEALRASPEVAAASANNYLPLAGGGSIGTLDAIEGYPKPQTGLSTHQRTIAAGYFRALGVPILAGREFGESDYGAKTTLVVVSEKFAKQYLGGRDRAVGKGIRQLSDGPWQRVIGVAADVKSNSLEQQPLGEVYRLLDQDPQQALYLALRPSPGATPASLAPLLRAAVAQIEPRAALGEFRTMRQRIWQAGAARRFHTSIMSSFASLSLLLGLVGLFGLATQWVQVRTREIGVRMALGATRRMIFALVLRQGLRPLFLGTLAGIALAWGLAQVMSGFVYGISARDPFTFIAVPALLLAGGLAAFVAPCLHATRVDPNVALRNE